MKPTEFIKILTGKMLVKHNEDVEEIVKNYKSSDDWNRANVDRFRVKKYLSDCIRFYKNSK